MINLSDDPPDRLYPDRIGLQAYLDFQNIWAAFPQTTWLVDSDQEFVPYTLTFRTSNPFPPHWTHSVSPQFSLVFSSE